MKEHVQHRAERAKLTAKPERRHHDARMVYARIGQHAAKVSLSQNEGRCYQDRSNAEPTQQFAGELMTDAFFCQHVEPGDAVDSAVDKSCAQQCRRGNRRLFVGVGFPGVHRRDAGLRPVTKQNEDKSQAHRCRIELVRHFH